MTLFVLCKKGLKTYPHADAKQRKTLLWPWLKKFQTTMFFEQMAYIAACVINGALSAYLYLV
jgi:hypothetical protein